MVLLRSGVKVAHGLHRTIELRVRSRASNNVSRVPTLARGTVNSRKITSRGTAYVDPRREVARELSREERRPRGGTARPRDARACGPVNCRCKARKMPHQPDPELYGSVFLSPSLSLSRTLVPRRAERR